MKNLKFKIILVILILISSFFLMAKPFLSSKDVVFWMEMKNKKIVYRVESKIIPAQKLLDYFGELYTLKKTNCTIFILSQDDLPVSYIKNAEMVIKKVADFKIRYFMFNEKTEKAKEIFFSDELFFLSSFK